MLTGLYSRARQFLYESSLPPIVRAVRADSLTYLEHAALLDLFDRVQEIEKQRREGILIEAGCALGGSAIVIATAKSPRRWFYVHDVFGMIPPPSNQDGQDVQDRYAVISSGRSHGLNGNTYYGYEDNLLDKVGSNFHRHGVPVESNNDWAACADAFIDRIDEIHARLPAVLNAAVDELMGARQALSATLESRRAPAPGWQSGRTANAASLR